MQPIMRRLKNISPGEIFEDINGQRFLRMAGERENCPWFSGRRKTLYPCRCLFSPVRHTGPITSAFFTEIGSVLWLPGMQETY